MRRGERNLAGFTLLEVVVTLAVLSISLTVLMRLFSSVTSATHSHSDYYQALKIAESRMSLLAANAGPSARGSGTVDDYFHWKSHVEVYRAESENPLSNTGYSADTQGMSTPYLLSVAVSWGEGKSREVELTTVRLGVQP